ncbi:hypothetical protein V2J09_016080 [Rumex salicifolius]
MAPSLSGAKFLSALVLDTISISRRGYASASQGAVTASRSAATVRIGKEDGGRSAENSWVPDPVTGYYRPANRANEIDGAELREMLLKQRSQYNLITQGYLSTDGRRAMYIYIENSTKTIEIMNRPA